MKELEKHLQIGLQRFLDLKKVLDSFQEEIEYSDDSINGFIQVNNNKQVHHLVGYYKHFFSIPIHVDINIKSHFKCSQGMSKSTDLILLIFYF